MILPPLTVVRPLRAWLAGALVLAALGCGSGVSVRRAAGPGLFDAWRASASEAGELSPRTRQTLRRWDLERLYLHQPLEAYSRLRAQAVQDPQPDLLFALAEISYLLGREAEKAECGRACPFYYLSAGYAYHYLFADSGPGGNPFDPRFRLACDLYNTSLAKCIRAAQRVGRLDARRELHLGGDGDFTLSVSHHGFPWPPSEFGPLLFSGDFQVVGLANQYRTYGLGVALIGTRRGDDADNGSGHAFYPREVAFPVTAFFRFEGGVADLGTCRCGRLELYNPLESQAVQVRGRTIPLETDLTTPLAYFLSRSDLGDSEYAGFLNADKVRGRAGIYMFEPYQPGKIPVVMVHGLLSSPLTWATMFNDLRADSTLRQHFQFWFYLYPTADSYLATAADLRRSLARLRQELDPYGKDPALDEMVFVGHSMGGLVSRLLTVDSGNDFWAVVSREPFDQVKAQPDTRQELEDLFFFKRQACVRRVVFIGTPHHGSYLSPSWPVQLVAQFIQLPRDLTQAAQDLAQENPGIRVAALNRRVLNSVDLLAPRSPALELLARRPKAEGMHYHSIIGDVTGRGAAGTDTVVSVASAHLDGVDSEVIVPAAHTSLQHHPQAVLEVWRILLEHLREVRGEDEIRPAAGAAR